MQLEEQQLEQLTKKAATGEKMCRGCWNVDRETYLGSAGEYIGEFVPWKSIER